jgi:LysR family glycine cleavage system transcriptional activator
MASATLPHLTWLRAFEATARHLSFTLAARELNLTQSAVSQHVRNLESFLGRELFERRTRALELTEAGANYLPTVREAFDLIAQGTRSFIGGAPGRSILVQCNLGFSLFWLTPRLARLKQLHPWLTLNIVTPIWNPEREADQAALEIRFAREGDISSQAERLTRDRFFPVCRPDYQGGAVDLDTAVLFDCPGITGSWEAWFKSQGRSFTRGAEVMIGSTFGIGINAALQGAGIAMAHDTLVGDMIARGELVRPFDHAPPLSEGYFLLAPPRHAETPASRAFIAWMKSELDTA